MSTFVYFCVIYAFFLFFFLVGSDISHGQLRWADPGGLEQWTALCFFCLVLVYGDERDELGSYAPCNHG